MTPAEEHERALAAAARSLARTRAMRAPLTRETMEIPSNTETLQGESERDALADKASEGGGEVATC